MEKYYNSYNEEPEYNEYNEYYDAELGCLDDIADYLNDGNTLSQKFWYDCRMGQTFEVSPRYCGEPDACFTQIDEDGKELVAVDAFIEKQYDPQIQYLVEESDGYKTYEVDNKALKEQLEKWTDSDKAISFIDHLREVDTKLAYDAQVLEGFVYQYSYEAYDMSFAEYLKNIK